MMGMPKVTRAAMELVLLQYRSTEYKTNLMAAIESENPHVCNAFNLHLEAIKETYGEEAMVDVGQFLMLTYAMLRNQAEADELDNQFGDFGNANH